MICFFFTLQVQVTDLKSSYLVLLPVEPSVASDVFIYLNSRTFGDRWNYQWTPRRPPVATTKAADATSVVENIPEETALYQGNI